MAQKMQSDCGGIKAPKKLKPKKAQKGKTVKK